MSSPKPVDFKWPHFTKKLFFNASVGIAHPLQKSHKFLQQRRNKLLELITYGEYYLVGPEISQAKSVCSNLIQFSIFLGLSLYMRISRFGMDMWTKEII